MQSATHPLTTTETTGSGPSSAPIHQFPGFENCKLSAVHPRATVLFREGQIPKGVYLLRSGSIKLTTSSRRGKILILRVARAGELLGLNSVLGRRAHDATAEALEDCRAEFISCAEFLELLVDRQVADHVLQLLLHDADETLQTTRLLLLSDTAAEKLAGLLLKWGRNYGIERPHGIRVNNSFTHEEISQIICTSRETVTRLLGDFARRELIQLCGNSIVIKDLKGLESIGR